MGQFPQLTPVQLSPQVLDHKMVSHIVVYLNDILIFADNEAKLEQLTHKVLGILQEYDLFLCPQKCKFEKREIAYLRLVIRFGEVLMDPSKVNAIC